VRSRAGQFNRSWCWSLSDDYGVGRLEHTQGSVGSNARLRKKERNPNAGTGFTPAPVFGLITGGETQGGRPVISQRGLWPRAKGLTACVNSCTPRRCGGAWARRPQRWSLGTGRMWIWRLADDRFPEARQRLDYYSGATSGGGGTALLERTKTNSRNGCGPWSTTQEPVVHQSSATVGRDRGGHAGGRPPKRRKRKSTICKSIRSGWITGRKTAGEPSAAGD